MISHFSVDRMLARRILALRALVVVPSRVVGHVVVVSLCLVVAYAGQASPIDRGGPAGPDQQIELAPSAIVVPGPADPDLLAPRSLDTGAIAPSIARAGVGSPSEIVRSSAMTTSDPIQTGATPSSASDSRPALSSSPDSAVVRADLTNRSWTRPPIIDAADSSSSTFALAMAPTATADAVTVAAPSTPDAHPTPAPARSDTARTLAPIVYVVVDGDTLSSVAQHFGVSVASIAAASGLQGDQDSLAIHQKLVIPPVPGVVHVVQPGETLDALANRYSASFDQIALANGLKDPFTLQVGQTLVIPDGKLPSAAPLAPTLTPTPIPSPTPSPRTTYTVGEGDSVSSIANAFGVDLRAIVNANGLSVPYVLHPGQQIVIPGALHPAPPPPVTEAPTTAKLGTTYTVRVGDSLSRIAVTFGIEPAAIVGANELTNPNSLRAGQTLVIPGASRPIGNPNPSPVQRPATPTPEPASPAPPTATAVPATATPVPPTATPASTQAPVPRHSLGSGWPIVAAASKYLGAPYVWGGTTPRGFDCSGLVWYVYRIAGVSVPRDMWGQLQSGTHVSRSNLQPGDVVFFTDTYQAGLSHDGIYIGGGRFINAENTTVGVAVASLSNPYWSSRYYGATRPW